jgi:hypothetical protein
VHAKIAMVDDWCGDHAAPDDPCAVPPRRGF